MSCACVRGSESTEEEAPRIARDMRKAAAPWPTNSAVQAALAEAEFNSGDLDAAEAAAARALAADPRNGDALTYRARVAMARAEASTPADAAAWKEVRRLIAQANRADPNDPEPLLLYYQSFAVQKVAPTPLAVDGLLRAFELAPQDLALRMTAARQLLVDGKTAEARAALPRSPSIPMAGRSGSR